MVRYNHSLFYYFCQAYFRQMCLFFIYDVRAKVRNARRRYVRRYDVLRRRGAEPVAAYVRRRGAVPDDDGVADYSDAAANDSNGNADKSGCHNKLPPVAHTPPSERSKHKLWNMPAHIRRKPHTNLRSNSLPEHSIRSIPDKSLSQIFFSWQNSFSYIYPYHAAKKIKCKQKKHPFRYV